MTDINTALEPWFTHQLTLEKLDRVATEYWTEGDYTNQAATLKNVLQLTGLSISEVYTYPEFLSLYVKNRAITEEDLYYRSDIVYWAVIVPLPSAMGKMEALMDELLGITPKPKYQVGYHKVDGTVDAIKEVDTLMAVIDIVSIPHKL